MTRKKEFTKKEQELIKKYSKLIKKRGVPWDLKLSEYILKTFGYPLLMTDKIIKKEVKMLDEAKRIAYKKSKKVA